MDPSSDPVDAAFEQAFAAADRIPGWLTRDQAAELWRCASAVPEGATVVEIGCHRGRSTVVLAAARPQGEVVGIDPFLPDWRYGRTDTRARLEGSLEALGLAERVRLIEARSQDVRRSWSGPVAMVYVDGKHDYWSTADDLRWAEQLPDAGTLLLHDAYSSLGVTTALLPRLLLGRRLVLRSRTGSLVRLEVRRPGLRDRVRALAGVPWWIRNLVIKVLLRARLRPLTRLLGHDDTADPF